MSSSGHARADDDDDDEYNLLYGILEINFDSDSLNIRLDNLLLYFNDADGVLVDLPELGVDVSFLSDEDELAWILPFINEWVIDAANDDNPQAQIKALQQYRELSSTENPCIDELIAVGLVPIFVRCLSRADYPKIQFEAAWILTNITYGTPTQTHEVVHAGAVPLLIDLLQSPDKILREQSLWALGNIIGDGPDMRDLVFQLGIVKPLTSFVKHDIGITFLREVTRVVLNLCRSVDTPPPLEVIKEILPILSALVTHNDTEMLLDTMWAINNILKNKRLTQMVIESGMLRELIALLSHEVMCVKVAVLKALVSIAAGTDEQTQAVLDCGVLSYIPALLSHEKERICRYALLILSNITAGNRQQVQAVIDAGLLPKIVEILSTRKLKTQREATWTISNITNTGSKDQIIALIDSGFIPAFCNLLKFGDTRTIELALHSIVNLLKLDDGYADMVAMLLEHCGAIEDIEALHNHSKAVICKTASEIIHHLSLLCRESTFSSSNLP